MGSAGLAAGWKAKDFQVGPVMSDFRIRWKSGNREFLFETSKYVVIALIVALSGASVAMPKGIADQISFLIEKINPH